MSKDLVSCPGSLDTDPPPAPTKDNYQFKGKLIADAITPPGEGAKPMDCYIVEPSDFGQEDNDGKSAIVVVYDIMGLTTPGCEVNMKHNADRESCRAAERLRWPL